MSAATPGPDYVSGRCDHTWKDGERTEPDLSTAGSGAICNRCSAVIPWRLIAAAPELLAAAEAIENCDHEADGTMILRRADMVRLRAAIAQATGEGN